MDALFRAAAENHLVISALVDANRLPELSRMCAAYPEAPVIIDHCSRLGASKRFPLNWLNAEILSHMAQHPQVYLKLGVFHALGRRQSPYLDLLLMIEQLVTVFTPQRCIWETDSPFQVEQHRYEESLALIRDHATFLTNADKWAILRQTCAKLLFQRYIPDQITCRHEPLQLAWRG